MPRPRLYSDEERKQRKQARLKQYYLDNVDSFKKRQEQYIIDNPEEFKETQRKSNKKNRAKRNEYQKNWSKKTRVCDPLFRLKQSIQVFINKSLHKKDLRTADILGCTWEQFKQHIESQFEPWMTWDNRGGKVVVGPNMTWDLDHIIPISSAVTEDDVKRLNHYTNFQPLCSYQNRFVKRNKM
jgi:hypothetical protein